MPQNKKFIARFLFFIIIIIIILFNPRSLLFTLMFGFVCLYVHLVHPRANRNIRDRMPIDRSFANKPGLTHASCLGKNFLAKVKVNKKEVRYRNS